MTAGPGQESAAANNRVIYERATNLPFFIILLLIKAPPLPVAHLWKNVIFL